MNKIVAVDDGLAPVKNYLSEQGCRTISIEAAKHQKVDAVILSGMDRNFLGMTDVAIDAPVVSAEGMSPEEIWMAIKQVSRDLQ